eukprot:TRINITY_DN58944_c0_g1_i1.p1 TRINITY_DN58944_c0_g1~~TRINITY_DN58944_c0_g1_i1.p1  ORF type:complete len:307 (-),score=44.92 TRINITY_DN58944_c0_g1_i1:273-1193(-)
MTEFHVVSSTSVEPFAADGSGIACDRHLPDKDGSGRPCKPRSGALFLHGFACDRNALGAHAQRAAAGGWLTAAPDMSSFTAGGSFREVFIEKSVRSAQLQNVRQATRFAKWLDAEATVLVGHSAGGAIALEAAVTLQEAGAPPQALLLLDAVGWDCTLDVAAKLDLEKTKVLSLRAEPSQWNKDGFITSVLERIPRQEGDRRLLDVKIQGSGHADCMQSQGWLQPKLLRLLGASGSGREMTDRIIDAFLHDEQVLRPSTDDSADASSEVVENGKLSQILDELAGMRLVEVARGDHKAFGMPAAHGH